MGNNRYRLAQGFILDLAHDRGGAATGELFLFQLCLLENKRLNIDCFDKTSKYEVA